MALLVLVISIIQPLDSVDWLDISNIYTFKGQHGPNLGTSYLNPRVLMPTHACAHYYYYDYYYY
jgi:hypothetical protein